MKNIVTLATNDLRLFLRDRMALVWLVGMPLVFIWVMGLPNFAGDRNPANAQPGVLIENADTGFAGRIFLEELGSEGLRILNPEQKAEGKRGVRVPADFTARLLAKERVDVEFFKIEGSDDGSAFLIELRVIRALIAFNAHIMGNAQKNPGGDSLTEEGLRAVLTASNPVSLDARFAGRKPVPVHFNQSLPGTLVMYLLLNLLIFGGTRVASDRELGVLRRITIHPVSRMELVLGRIGGLVLLSLVPITVLLFLGQVFFKVNLVDRLPWILLTLVMFAWVSASFGVLVGFLVKAPEKIIALCLLVTFPVAALGGCWWPLDILPEWLQTVGHLSPAAWAMDALHQFITFGGGIEAAAGALGVLALIGLVANLAAMKFFRV